MYARLYSMSQEEARRKIQLYGMRNELRALARKLSVTKNAEAKQRLLARVQQVKDMMKELE